MFHVKHLSKEQNSAQRCAPLQATLGRTLWVAPMQALVALWGALGCTSAIRDMNHVSSLYSWLSGTPWCLILCQRDQSRNGGTTNGPSTQSRLLACANPQLSSCHARQSLLVLARQPRQRHVDPRPGRLRVLHSVQ